MQYQVLWLPKDGNSPEEYEDAFAPIAGEVALPHVLDAIQPANVPPGLRFAIADGATESSFAAQWARLLVEGFAQIPTEQALSWATWLPPLQKRWIEEVGGKALPWYAEPKFKVGAFATFLGLQLNDLDRGEGFWNALAVGDSCLLHLRGGDGFMRSFPMTRSEEFGVTPWLLGSRSPIEEIDDDKKSIGIVGEWKVGDRFWLMTDALAKWCLQRQEAGARAWEDIDRVLAEPAGFNAWIETLWNKGELRNDDITLMAIRL